MNQAAQALKKEGSFAGTTTTRPSSSWRRVRPTGNFSVSGPAKT